MLQMKFLVKTHFYRTLSIGTFSKIIEYYDGENISPQNLNFQFIKRVQIFHMSINIQELDKFSNVKYVLLIFFRKRNSRNRNRIQLSRITQAVWIAFNAQNALKLRFSAQLRIIASVERVSFFKKAQKIWHVTGNELFNKQHYSACEH